MSKRVLTQIDDRQYWVEVPDDAQEKDYHKGIVIGPPYLGELGLPSELELRLHNELLNRGLITAKDARQPGAVMGAWQAAMKVSVTDLLNLYG